MRSRDEHEFDTVRVTLRIEKSLALRRPCLVAIALFVHRIKAAIALMLALVWLPAVSCCLLDASGWLGKQHCCSKEHSQRAPGPGNCDQACGALASATFLPQQSQPLVLAPVGVLLFNSADPFPAIHRPAGVGFELPATAPPELAGHWQFSLRTALAPRAPSSAS